MQFRHHRAGVVAGVAAQQTGLAVVGQRQNWAPECRSCHPHRVRHVCGPVAMQHLLQHPGRYRSAGTRSRPRSHRPGRPRWSGPRAARSAPSRRGRRATGAARQIRPWTPSASPPDRRASPSTSPGRGRYGARGSPGGALRRARRRGTLAGRGQPRIGMALPGSIPPRRVDRAHPCPRVRDNGGMARVEWTRTEPDDIEQVVSMLLLGEPVRHTHPTVPWGRRD